MVIGSSPSLSAASGVAFQRLQQQQAERAAEQADVKARALKDRANEAENEASRAEEEARTLSVEASQANRQAGEARQNVAALRSLSDVQDFLQKTRDQIASSTTAAASQPVSTSPPAVVNAEGQAVGQLVNVTA